MKIISTILLGASCAMALPLTASAAALRHHHARRAVHASGYGYAPRGNGYPGYGYDDGYGYRGPTSAAAGATLNGNSFNAGAAQIPSPGTYSNYNGPGAIVLRRGLEAQFEPGVTEELYPDAKQTATGGPAGGIPGAGGR